MTPWAASVPQRSPSLRLGERRLPTERAAVMAIVNRTPDSFYPPARQVELSAALDAVDRAVQEGADIVDVGGVRAGRGPEVGPGEEIDRVVPLIAAARTHHPDTAISVDTWRAEVAGAAIEAGADLINDTWAGHDPSLVAVAARGHAGVVCSHTGGARPRTDPFRVAYPDPPGGAHGDGVVRDVLQALLSAAEGAQVAGIPAQSILIDPTIDFGKNTWHSLRLIRGTPLLTGHGYPVLMALSRKDFVGEMLGLPVDQRLEGSLAATAVACWLGASVIRAHDVRATLHTVQMVAGLRDEMAPVAAIRGQV